MSIISGALPKNRFVRGVAVLVSGTVGAQALMVLAAPLLTRLYTPQDFGLLAVFVGLLSIVAVTASLRYELAIPLPSDEREAAALLVLSLSSVLVVAALSAIPVFFYRNAIAGLLNTPALADYLDLVPLGTLFVGAFNVLNVWAIRVKAFTPLAKTKFSQSVAAVGIQVGGASLGPVALLLGQVAGQAAGSLSLGLRVLRQQWGAIVSVRLSDIALVARRYKRFPLFSTWSALFNTAGMQLPPLLFAALFSPAAAGMYALANRVLAAPMQILGQAIASVFFSGAAQAHREGGLGLLVANIHRRLAHIAMPPICILLIGGPEIFSRVFGTEWREAGIFAQWLAPWLYLVFITSPLSPLFDVLNKQDVEMAFEIASLIIRVAAIVAGAWIGDVMTAVVFISIGSIACRLANMVWLLRASGNGWGEIWRPTLSALAWGVILVSPIILSALWEVDRLLWFSALAMTAVLISARYVYLMKDAWL